MKLLPSLKQKKRYLVFEIIAKKEFTVSEIDGTIKEAIKSFIGELGLAKTAPLFIKLKNQTFIIKVNHKYVDQVKASLALIKTIKNSSIVFKSLTTTGTIKKANEVLK